MLTQPTISVLLPVYNAERYVAQAIESVLAQTFFDFELIAIDDGSTDHSFEIMSTFTDSRLRVIRQENRGLPATLNRCAELSHAPYLARMDADDICKPDRFARQYEYLQTHSEAALVSGAVEYIDESGQILGRTYPITKPSLIRKKLINQGNIIVHPAVMMRSDAFALCRGYCESLTTMEDQHLWMKFIRNGFDLHILRQVMIAYRISSGAISNWTRTEEQIRLMDEILQQYEPDKELLELFCTETSKAKSQPKSDSQRAASIKETAHCRIWKISRQLHSEWIAERLVCGLHNMYASAVSHRERASGGI